MVNTGKYIKMKILISALVIAVSFACQSSSPGEYTKSVLSDDQSESADTATFAGGCFWCIEAAFEQIEGVYEAVSGYSGGKASTADYKTVSSGRTKHAEVVQIYFNPKVIDYGTLLDILFTAHDPTQLNRQGPDVGPQYRSAVFYHNDNQRNILESKIEEWQPSFSRKIVTEVVPLENFYLAEEYHQDYERRNPFQPYILSVSKPKVDKVKAKFKDRLKPDHR